jgi:hypothetical protein
MNNYTITHSHKYGTTNMYLQSEADLSSRDLPGLLGLLKMDFEPEYGDSVELISMPAPFHIPTDIKLLVKKIGESSSEDIAYLSLPFNVVFTPLSDDEVGDFSVGEYDLNTSGLVAALRKTDLGFKELGEFEIDYDPISHFSVFVDGNCEYAIETLVDMEPGALPEIDQLVDDVRAEMLTQCVNSAEEHASESGDAGHECGDLQDMLACALSMLNANQLLELDKKFSEDFAYYDGSA